MTLFEAITLFAVCVSAVFNVLQARSHDHTTAQLDYLRGLYADAIAQLEAVTRERDYYKREWAARWDVHAHTYGTPPPPPFFGTTGADGANASQQPRHVGAGE